MAGKLISPIELAPPVPHDLNSEQCIAQWREAYDAGETLLLAGLARDAGPGGDVQAAYRQWNEDYLRQHDDMIVRVFTNLHSRETAGGR